MMLVNARQKGWSSIELLALGVLSCCDFWYRLGPLLYPESSSLNEYLRLELGEVVLMIGNTEGRRAVDSNMTV